MTAPHSLTALDEATAMLLAGTAMGQPAQIYRSQPRTDKVCLHLGVQSWSRQ